MKKEIPFLKGHMGGNEIVLAPRGRFPESAELELSLEILERPQIGGDQLGLLFDLPETSHVGAKIIDINSRDYIPMCGGMTQVLGKAHLELDISDIFELDSSMSNDEIRLETELGGFPIRDAPEGRVITVMDTFLNYVYEAGVERGTLNGVKSFKVGDYFVTFEDEIKKRYPETSFHPLNKEAGEILIELQKKFRHEFDTGKENRDLAIIGEPENEARTARLIFPHNISEGLIEPTCGTGAVAAAVALVEKGSISGSGRMDLGFETGGGKEYIGGPEVTKVVLEVKSGKVRKGQFSHELVEILAAGNVFL